MSTHTPYPIRRASADDMAEIARLDGTQFAYHYTGEVLDETLNELDPERFLLAIDDGRIVGAAADFALNFTVPGGNTLDLPGVTWVSVAPTHTRRGILRSLIEAQLREYANCGKAGAALTASESSIYGRFGYGAATVIRGISVERRRTSLRERVDATSVRLATPDEARAAMPGIHERWRRQIPAGIGRSAARWDAVISDKRARSVGEPDRLYLLHDDGYVAFRPRPVLQDGHFESVCHVNEYAAVTPQAHAALWQTMLALDLYARIDSEMVPADDPITHLVTNPRQIRTTMLNDGVWLRPLDVPALMTARTYAVEFEVVWEVRDALFGDARYRIQGGPDGATVSRTDQLPNLTTDVSTLGALYFGGHRLQSLAAGGFAACDDAALLTRLDRALLADRAPFHGTAF